MVKADSPCQCGHLKLEHYSRIKSKHHTSSRTSCAIKGCDCNSFVVAKQSQKRAPRILTLDRTEQRLFELTLDSAS